jgi:hypothetical protein
MSIVVGETTKGKEVDDKIAFQENIKGMQL